MRFSLLDLIYPQDLYCLCCKDTIPQSRIHGICDRCAEKIDWLDHDPFRASLDEFAFDELMSCCVCGFYPRQIVHGLKLHAKPYIAKNIGLLMNNKNIFFIPMSQDDPVKKPNSVVAHFDKTPEALKSALSGTQIQPIYI